MFSNPFLRGFILSGAFLTSYLLTVILTSPMVSPFDAVVITLNANSLFLLVLFFSIFIQGYLGTVISTIRGCRVGKETVGSLTVGGTSLSSIVSFLSLIHLGCCSMWLYILSIIAGTGGIGLAFVSTLLQAPSYVMTLGITAIWAGNTYMIIKYIKHRKKTTSPPALRDRPQPPEE